MNGDLTSAFAETIGTMWDSEEQTHNIKLDQRAVFYFQHQIMVLNNPDNENDRPEVYDAESAELSMTRTVDFFKKELS